MEIVKMEVSVMIVQRPEYLDFLKRWKDQQIIKVVSGVRRCGKSTLFDLFKADLRENGVAEEQIIAINFEEIDYEHLTDYRQLYAYIKERLLPDRMNYIFLDEIQHCEKFEKAVDSLFIKSNCDVYITGSNAYFMSGELATFLSGRYVELNMLPLSFKEFSVGLEERHPSLTDRQKFNLYLEYGAFPYLLNFDTFGKDARDYLRSLYNTIILKDVVKRLKVSDVSVLENIAKFMLHNVGNRASATKIANTLKSAGKGADQKTVDKYIGGLSDALLLYEATRYNIKGKQFLTTQRKYYAVDLGFRNVLVRGKDSDEGHILENIIYLELKRRGYDVYVGEIDNGEVDFVAISDGKPIYFQVAASTLDPATLSRELAPFERISDNYPKYLLTLDEVFANADYEGIVKMNAIDWLLGNKH